MNQDNLLTQLINCSNDAILYLSDDFDIIDLNSLVEKIYGWNKDKILGEKYFDLCNRNNIKPIIIPEELKSLSCQEKQRKYQLINSQNGIEYHLVWTISRVPKGNKSSVIFLIGQDISKEKLLEKKREIAELYLDGIISQVPEYIFWKDKNSVYLGCNDLLAESAGLKSRMDVIGKADYDFGWDAERVKLLKVIDEEVITKGISNTIEEIIPLPRSGEKRTMITKKVPFKDKEGNILGILGISFDITDRKLAEELRIKNEAAEKLIKFTNLIAGSMAHELRTPLAAINTYSDLFKAALLSNDSLKEKENTCLEIYKKIKRIIKASTHMINDMLVKLRSFALGVLPQVNFTTLEMAKSIERFMNAYPFEEKESKLVTIIDNDSFLYKGDNLLTEHLLSNLVKNSLKAIQENDWKGNIIITLKREDHCNKLFVRDTATGISKEFLPKIFYQFETTNTKSGGTGLGLAFCKMVMDYYGGVITCTSEEGKYTEFILSFPKVLS